MPIAPFEVVSVSQDLIGLGSRSDLADLGEGLAFGSCRRSIVELTVVHQDQISAALQRDVLMFDWWIKNGDRTQTDVGGNPNLFWDVDNDSLLVLDHNQAFDPDFTRKVFEELHPFRAHMDEIFSDMVERDAYATRFVAAMATWDAICDTVPLDWWYLDQECTIPLEFDRHSLKRMLLDCRSNAFWTMP